MAPERSMRRQKTADTWAASNRALALLIERDRGRLTAVSAAAERIRGRLLGLFPALDTLCRSTCPWCPEPCCIVNKVWFDFADLLFQHLLHLPIPPGPVATGAGRACRYLGGRGCRLPRLQRPWACTRYICATQWRRLDAAGPPYGHHLKDAIGAIARKRATMEEAFVRAVARCSR